MKKFLKWALLVIVVVATCGFLAFLYFIPPFFLTPPETFGKAMADAAPTVDDIADPAERAIAERGRYVSRNLTPDKDTGLARRTDDEVKRVHAAPEADSPRDTGAGVGQRHHDSRRNRTELWRERLRFLKVGSPKSEVRSLKSERAPRESQLGFKFYW